MRDKKRIKPFLETIEKLWLYYPDYRFGQLIYLMAGEIGRDIFFPEEEEWIDKINGLIVKHEEWKNKD